MGLLEGVFEECHFRGLGWQRQEGGEMQQQAELRGMQRQADKEYGSRDDGNKDSNELLKEVYKSLEKTQQQAGGIGGRR